MQRLALHPCMLCVTVLALAMPESLSAQSPAPNGQPTSIQTDPVAQAPPPSSPPAASAPSKPPAGAPATGGTPPARDPLDLSLEELTRQDVRPNTGGSTPGSAPAGQSRVSQDPSGNTVSPSNFDLGNTGGLGELFNQAPGVNVRRTSAINLDPRVRGFNTSQLNASADGMTELKARLDIDTLFSQVDPANVESVSVLDGPYSSLYGPWFAFLTAKLAAAPRYADGFELHDVTAFSNDSNGRQINAHERLLFGGPDWGVNISYGLRSGGDYLAGRASDAFPVPSSYRQQDVYMATGIDLTSQTRIEFNYIHQNLYDVELPGVAYDVDRSGTDQFNTRFVWQEDPKGVENLVLQFWEERTGFNGDTGRLSKFRTFVDLLLDQPLPEFIGEVGHNFGTTESSGFRVLSTIGGRDTAKLTYGADWRRVEMSYEEQALNSEGEPGIAGGPFGIPRSSIEDAGLFFHFVDPLTKELTVTFGGRYDHTQAFLDRSDPVASNNAADALPFLPGFSEPENNLYMLYTTGEYKPVEWLQLTSGVAYAMREANLTELYSDETVVPLVRFGNSIAQGNSDLAPEKDLQFDVGITGKWDRLSLGARAFYSTINDYILPVASDASHPIPAGVNAPSSLGRTVSAFGISSANPLINAAADTASLAYRYTNIDEASLYGTEVFGELKILTWMSLIGQMAYVKGMDDAPVRYVAATNSIVPLGGHEPLPNIYPLNSTVTLRIFEPRNNKWDIEFVTRMVAGQHSVATSLAEVQSQGFTVFGLRGSYRVSEHFRLYSSIDNLFDRSYSEPGSLAIVTPSGTIGFVKEPGFSWIVGFEAKF